LRRAVKTDLGSLTIVDLSQFLIRRMAEKLLSDVKVPAGNVSANCTKQ